MRIMWIGFKITEKQFKKLNKGKKGEPVKICPEAFIGMEFMGRKFKFKNIVGGKIE